MASRSSSNPPAAPGRPVASGSVVGGAPSLIPQGQHRGKPGMTLSRPFTLAGARNRAHLHLLSNTVSKCHAGIIHDNGRVYVRDLSSRTHVYVNGRIIREIELSDGDLLQIGSFTFKVAIPAGANVSTPPPAQLDLLDSGQTLPLDGRTTTIGRRSTCDLAIEDETVSTVHAIVFELDGQRYIRDLGSRTGTFVNGTAIHQQPLNIGDRIRVGPMEYRYSEAAHDSGSFDDMAELEDLVGTARLGHDEQAGLSNLAPAGGRRSIAEPGVPATEGESTMDAESALRATSAAGLAASGLAAASDNGHAAPAGNAPIPLIEDDADLIPLARESTAHSQTEAAPEPEPLPEEIGEDDFAPIGLASETPAARPEPEIAPPPAPPEPIDLDAEPEVGGMADTRGFPPPRPVNTAPPTISPLVEDYDAGSAETDDEATADPSGLTQITPVDAPAEGEPGTLAAEMDEMDLDLLGVEQFGQERQGQASPQTSASPVADESGNTAVMPELPATGETTADLDDFLLDIPASATPQTVTPVEAPAIPQVSTAAEPQETIAPAAETSGSPPAPAPASEQLDEAFLEELRQGAATEQPGTEVLAEAPAQDESPAAEPEAWATESVAVEQDAAATIPAALEETPVDSSHEELPVEWPAEELPLEVPASATPTSLETPVAEADAPAAPSDLFEESDNWLAEVSPPLEPAAGEATAANHEAATPEESQPSPEHATTAGAIELPDLDDLGMSSNLIGLTTRGLPEEAATDLHATTTHLPEVPEGTTTDSFAAQPQDAASSETPAAADAGSGLDFLDADQAPTDATVAQPSEISSTIDELPDLESPSQLAETTAPPAPVNVEAAWLDDDVAPQAVAVSPDMAAPQPAAPQATSPVVTSMAPAVAATAIVAAGAATSAAAEAAQPKRSFWGKLFGRKPAASAPPPPQQAAPAAQPPAPLAATPIAMSPATVIGEVQPPATVIGQVQAPLAPATPQATSTDLETVDLDALDLNATDETSAAIDSVEPPPPSETVAETASDTNDADASTWSPEPPAAEPAPWNEPPTLNESTNEPAVQDELPAVEEPQPEATAVSPEDGAGNVEDGVYRAAGEPADNEQFIGRSEIILPGMGGHGTQMVLSGAGLVGDLWGITTSTGGTVNAAPPMGEGTPPVLDYDTPKESSADAFDSVAGTSTEAQTPAAHDPQALPESFDDFLESLPDVPPATETESAELTGETTYAPIEPAQTVAAEPPAASAQPALEAEAFHASPEVPALADPAALTTPDESSPTVAPIDPFFGMSRDMGSFIGGMPLSLGGMPQGGPTGATAPAPQQQFTPPLRPSRPRLPFGDAPVTFDSKAQVLAEVVAVENQNVPVFGAPLPEGAAPEKLESMRSDLFPEAELVDAFGRVPTAPSRGQAPAQRAPVGEGFGGSGSVTGASTFGPGLGEAFPTGGRSQPEPATQAPPVERAAHAAPTAAPEVAAELEPADLEPVDREQLDLEPVEAETVDVQLAAPEPVDQLSDLTPSEFERLDEGPPDELAPLAGFDSAEWRLPQSQAPAEWETPSADAPAHDPIEPAMIETGPVPVETEAVPLEAELDAVTPDVGQPVLDLPAAEPVDEAPDVTFAAVEPALPESEASFGEAEPTHVESAPSAEPIVSEAASAEAHAAPTAPASDGFDDLLDELNVEPAAPEVEGAADVASLDDLSLAEPSGTVAGPLDSPASGEVSDLAIESAAETTEAGSEPAPAERATPPATTADPLIDLDALFDETIDAATEADAATALATPASISLEEPAAESAEPAGAAPTMEREPDFTAAIPEPPPLDAVSTVDFDEPATPATDVAPTPATVATQDVESPPAEPAESPILQSEVLDTVDETIDLESPVEDAAPPAESLTEPPPPLEVADVAAAESVTNEPEIDADVGSYASAMEHADATHMDGAPETQAASAEPQTSAEWEPVPHIDAEPTQPVAMHSSPDADIELYPAAGEMPVSELEVADTGEPSPLFGDSGTAQEVSGESTLSPEDADLWALEAMEHGAPIATTTTAAPEPPPLFDDVAGYGAEGESTLVPPATTDEFVASDEFVAPASPIPEFEVAQPFVAPEPEPPATVVGEVPAAVTSEVPATVVGEVPAIVPGETPDTVVGEVPATVMGEVPSPHGGPATTFEQMFSHPAGADQPALPEDFFDDLEPAPSSVAPEPASSAPVSSADDAEVALPPEIPTQPEAASAAPFFDAATAATGIGAAAAMGAASSAKPARGVAPPRPRLTPGAATSGETASDVFAAAQSPAGTTAPSTDSFGAPTAGTAAMTAGQVADVFAPGPPAALTPARSVPAARRSLVAPSPSVKPAVSPARKPAPAAAKKPLGTAAGPTAAAGTGASPAPLARKLNTPAVPRKAIAARPGLNTGVGFRPPTVPPRAAGAAPATPAMSMTELARPAPARPAAAVARVAPRDPFTNAGDAPVVPPKSRRTMRLVLIILAVVLVAAAIAFVFWKFGPTGTVRGSLRFQNLWKNEVAESDRKLFQAKQRAMLLDPAIVQTARLDLGDTRVSAGFLADDAAISRLRDGATWDPATESLVLTHADANPEDSAERERMLRLLTAMRQTYLRNIAGGTPGTGDTQTDQRELDQLEEEIEKVNQQREDLKEKAATTTAKRTEADRLGLDVEEHRRKLTESSGRVLALERELAKLDAGRPGTRPSTQPGDEAAPETDPELAQMELQLKLMNDSLTAAIETKETSVARAKAFLDAAQKRFDEQVAAAKDVAAGHALLSEYLEKVAPVQLELRRLDDELVQQQKDERADLETLRKTLSDQATARIQRAWNDDAELVKFTKRRAVVERQHSAAASLGLPEADGLRKELSELDAQINGRRTAIAVADERDPVNQKLAEYFEASLRRIEQSRKRNESRLKTLVETLTKAKPAMDKLPANQQARAKSVDEALNSLTAARDAYTSATAQANANSDTLVRELSGQAAAQQARVEARRKELAEARVADPTAPTDARSRKVAERNRAQEGEANLWKKLEELEGAHRQAEADATAAVAAQRMLPDLDRQVAQHHEKKAAVLRRLAAKKATPESLVTVAEVLPESITLSSTTDKRGYYVGFAGIGGLVLVLLALAATRTPHTTYIPPMVRSEVREALPVARDDTFDGLVDPEDAFHASGDVFALPAPSAQQREIPKRILPV